MDNTKGKGHLDALEEMYKGSSRGRKLKETALYACTFVIDDNYMWFVAGRYNYLFCYNIESACVEKKFRLPEDNLHVRMYDNILLHNEKLYLIPFNGGDVLIFDRLQEQFECISIAPYNSKQERFYSATIYEDKLYLFAESISVQYDNPYLILKIDLAGKEGCKQVGLNISIPNGKKDYYEVFDRNYYVIEDKFYVLMSLTNKVLEYHLKGDIWKIYEIGNSDSQYATLQIDGKVFYLISQDGDVTVWNMETKETLEYKNLIVDYEVERKNMYAAFSCSFKYENDIYFVPRFANKIIMFNDKKAEEAFVLTKDFVSDEVMERAEYMKHFLCSVVKQDILYLWDYVSYKFYMINLKTKKWTSRKVVTIFTNNELSYMYQKCNMAQINGGVESQADYYNLGYFVHNIVKNKEINNLDGNKKNIGKTILQQII